MTGALRSIAIAVAVLALVDPAVAVKSEGPLPVEMLMPPPSHPGYESALAAKHQIARDLVDRVDVDSAEPARARVSLGGALPPDLSLPVIVFAPEAQGVRITASTIAAPAVQGQAVEVTVALEGHGVNGRTSTISLVDRGIPVARAEHAWPVDDGQHSVKLSYPAPAPGLVPLTVRVETPGVAAAGANIAAVVSAEALRTLVYEPRPSWAAAFVRRVLEGDPRFAVASLARSAPRIATRLGTAVRSLDALDPGDLDLIVVGALDALTSAELDVLDRFASLRGGGVLMLPDTRLPARVQEKFALPRTEETLLESAIRVGAPPNSVQVSELLLPLASQRLDSVIASVRVGAAERAVVFSAPRGDGTIVVSGLMDAWRYRGSEHDRFWRALAADLAAAAPPAIRVRLHPAWARSGDRVHLTAEWRRDMIEAGETVRIPPTTAALTGGSLTRVPLRLWPGDRAGVYEAWMDAPAAGTYAVVAEGAGVRGTAALRVDDGVQHPFPGTAHIDTLAAQTGGRVASNLQDLRDHFERLDSPAVVRSSRPMRSPWWIVPFAACLCAEWLVRRRRGLR